MPREKLVKFNFDRDDIMDAEIDRLTAGLSRKQLEKLAANIYKKAEKKTTKFIEKRKKQEEADEIINWNPKRLINQAKKQKAKRLEQEKEFLKIKKELLNFVCEDVTNHVIMKYLFKKQ